MKLSRVFFVALLLTVAGAANAKEHSAPVSGAADLSAVPASPLFAEPQLPTHARLLAGVGGINSKPPKERTKKPEAPQPGPAGTTSTRKAMLYSLLVPGLGQQVSGHAERARVFYAIEAGIWTSFVAFRLQGDARRDRYIQFAEFHGGVDPSGKDDNYWRLISRFERSDPGPLSANEFIRRQARALYPGEGQEDQAARDQYILDHGYYGDDAWDWQNTDNLARFRDLRTSSLDSYENSKFSIGLALAHRIVSMIDAARLAGRGSRSVSPKQGGIGQGEVEPGASSPLDSHGTFGVKLVKDGRDRVPMLTYRLTF